MKCIQIATVALLTPLLILFSSCSPDTEESIVEEEMVEVWQPPEPDWVDNDVTITVGNYQSGAEMWDKFRGKSNFAARRGMRSTLQEENFPLSGRKYSIKVSVFTLREMGFENPVEIEEIRERCIELRCRPMTLEESVELRLQLTNQPDEMKAVTDAEAQTDMEKKWSTFCTLLNKREAKFLGVDTQYLPDIYHCSDRDIWGEGYGIGVRPVLGAFDPNDGFIRTFAKYEGETNIRLAVVTEEITP